MLVLSAGPRVLGPVKRGGILWTFTTKHEPPTVLQRAAPRLTALHPLCMKTGSAEMSVLRGHWEIFLVSERNWAPRQSGSKHVRGAAFAGSGTFFVASHSCHVRLRFSYGSDLLKFGSRNNCGRKRRDVLKEKGICLSSWCPRGPRGATTPVLTHAGDGHGARPHVFCPSTAVVVAFETR